MTNLYDSSLKSILPKYLKEDKESQAFCYALDTQVKKLLDTCKKCEIWSDLMSVDEMLLNYLAMELRTQYYSSDLNTDIKRKLVSNTLKWYQKAGTVAAVEELITAVFGGGETKEWYEYGGAPHHFRAITSNPFISHDDIQQFNEIIRYIKRKTAIMDTIEIVLTATMNMHCDFKLQTGTYITVRQEG